jgi:hypothetical protein
MGTVPLTPWRSVIRALIRSVLLALLTALAWLVWGAGTATASSLVPDAGDLLTPATSLPAEPLPAPPVLVSAGEPAVAPAASLTDPATATVNTLAAPAIPVAAGAMPVVADAFPVAAGTVETATGLVPGLPDLPLVQEPLPLPLTDVLPLPDQLPPLLPEPLPVPLPLPGLPPLTTPAPGPVPAAAPSLPASDAAAPATAAALGLAPASTTTTPAARSNSLRFGFAAAQDLPGFASPPGATASPAGPADGTDNPGRLDPPALANGAGTAHSGSGGGSEGPADLAGSWPALPMAAHGPNAPGTQTLPTGPSFDPGSSPD